VAGSKTWLHRCPTLPMGPGARVGGNSKSSKVAAECQQCQKWFDISADENAASEPPLKLGIEDDPFCIQQRIAVVGFSEIDLVADLNVLGPIPD
jgi:hypothetical protein